MRDFLVAGFLAASLAILGCSDKTTAEGGKSAAEQAGKPVVAVDVVKVEPVEVSSSLEVVGTLTPKFEALVRAEIKSRVTEVYVTQWLPVKAGEMLSKSDTRDIETALATAKASLQAAKSQEEAAAGQMEVIRAQKESLKAQVETGKAALVEAEIGSDRAEREYLRMQKLFEAGLATRQGLDEALSAKDAAKARVGSAQAQNKALESQLGAADAQLAAAKSSREAGAANVAAAAQQVSGLETTLGKAVIRSPMSGVIAERFVNVGDLPGDTPLFHIVDNRVLNLNLSVPMRDQGDVRVGQEIDFSTEAVPGETFKGRVMFINPTVNQADRSVGVLAEVPNGEGKLKGGMFVNGKLATSSIHPVVAVPRAALAGWDVKGRSAEIYLVTGETANKRKIATGEVYGDLVEVTGGLAAGDAVVIRGGFNLKDGDRVAATVSKRAM